MCDQCANSPNPNTMLRPSWRIPFTIAGSPDAASVATGLQSSAIHSKSLLLRVFSTFPARRRLATQPLVVRLPSPEIANATGCRSFFTVNSDSKPI